ncbi:GNAT family N-acetyltransferase [Aeromicrobium fastidiosum]|uniref:GNAT family N-acetyltransferase n=1 Tax=Aeromicrobium fastidiosum TaxID=52699 RepID=A0A641AN94_9ACTN|nr:GNAT family N-acetyltransferase [Aeromicrobium fastidiosum]KAA1378593.1 GNAT family N-acetyltransferase [Aeromicrobium fastidiosum]MBP2392432.1 GNAT superfamily N-acetyltransferase [Aeromicrobium fastidiosum]
MVLDTSQQIIDQWVATWVHLRGITTSEVEGHRLVHVAGPSRETELVCIDPGVAELARLARHVAGDPRAMLTVVADDVGPYLTSHLPPGVRIDRDDETLMSTRLVGQPIPALPDDLTFRWDVVGNGTTYTLESGRSIAAVGTVGVLGSVATFDRVETMPAFQRRGLGRHVMAALTVQAMGRGATHGVLAATAQGSQLYSSLGWHGRLEMLSLMGT